MAALEKRGPDAGQVVLPRELCGSRPYPLPRWARTPPVGEIVLLLMAAVSSATFAWLATTPWMQLLPLAIAALGATMLRMRQRAREILQTGLPVVARVERVMAGDHEHLVDFSFDGPRGPETGRARWGIEVLPRDAPWPEAGDVVFLIVDRARPWSRVVWGFAVAPGVARGQGPWFRRRVSPAVVATTMGAVLLLIVALVWLGLR